MKYTIGYKETTIQESRDYVTKISVEQTTNILKKYISKIEAINDYLELEDIITDMIEDLREKSFFCMIDGEKYYVIRLVKELIKYDNEFKDCVLTEDKLNWITREFHDSQFDFDEFKNGVKEAMRYTEKNYEPSKY
jgi:hypothetical protein